MYSIIYADPPWQYQDRNPRGGAEKHYKTMPLAELCALPVKSIAAPDSVLFMWATWPLLREAMLLMWDWGFNYKTSAFDWAKTTKTGKYHFGMGHWTRGNTEPCLLGVRGKLRRVDASVPQLLVAPRGRHSAKPPEARDRIVKLMGDLPRVELFARERTPGWDVWGNEVESNVRLSA